MLAIGKKPITKADYVRRVIALHLDDRFISNKDGSHKFIGKSFDDLVEKIAASVERINDTWNNLSSPDSTK